MKKIVFTLSFLTLLFLCGCASAHWAKEIFHATAAVTPPPPPPPAAPIHAAIERIVFLFWIGGALSVVAGVALIVFAGMAFPGAKLIICGVVAPIMATWFSIHFATITACTLIGLAAWYLFTHAAARSAIRKEIQNLANQIPQKKI